MIDSLFATELMERDYDNMLATAKDGVFRREVYRFATPCVTAGRNARVSEDDICRWRDLDHAFARRPTGGGILRHEGDIAFGFAFPADDSFVAQYLGRVSEAARDALLKQGIRTTSCGESGPAAPRHCFRRAVGCELLLDGEKLLGLAARKVRGAVLIQGSLTVMRNPERDWRLIGYGPRVDLSARNFNAEKFAGAISAVLGLEMCAMPDSIKV